jgi:cytochrome P450
MEPNAAALTRTLFEDGENGKVPMDVYPLLRQVNTTTPPESFAASVTMMLTFLKIIVDLSLSLTYGVRVGEFDDEFANALLDSIATISSIRSSTVSYKHFHPLLRLFPEKTSKVMEAVKERTMRIDKLYNTYLQKVEKGQDDLKCIVSSLGDDKLTLEEIHGTCVSLLQAAPDTISSGIYQACAWLCSPEGQPFQKEALAAILEAYNGDRDEAWRNAFREEKVPLIVSLYKETLRFYPIAPFGLRRVSKEFVLRGTTIPKGMGVYLDNQGVNHDVNFFGPDALEFNPMRYVNNSSPLPHLTYGTGGRICPAYQISNRIMYAMLVKLILAFDMKQVSGTRLPSTARNDFSDAYGNVLFPRTYDCSFTARDKSWLKGVITAEKL